MLKLIVILALTAFAHCQTGTTASAPAGTTVAAAVGTTVAAAVGTTAASPAGTTAAPSPSPSPAGTTAAPSPSPSPAGTTAAPAPSPTPSSTTGIQYLAAGSTLVYIWTFANQSFCNSNIGGVAVPGIVPTGTCNSFITVPNVGTIYQNTRISATGLWANIYLDNACSNLIGTATLTNNVCGWFNVTISSNTITINLKTSWTAGALTTAVPVGSTTTGPAATTARPSSASTSVASFLVVALAAVAAALF
jgi:hypothetical protein